MEELFNILSCGAKFNKSNSKKNKEKLLPVAVACNSGSYCPIPEVRFVSNKDTTAESAQSSKKKKHSIEKQQQIHREEMAAFRRRLNIHIGKHCDTSMDPISKMVRTNSYSNAMHSSFVEREEGYFGSSTDWKW